jgi:hypothetical protein
MAGRICRRYRLCARSLVGHDDVTARIVFESGKSPSGKRLTTSVTPLHRVHRQLATAFPSKAHSQMAQLERGPAGGDVQAVPSTSGEAASAPEAPSTEPAMSPKHKNGLNAIRAFLRDKSSYDILPESFRLIVFDNQLGIKRALTALLGESHFRLSIPLIEHSSLTAYIIFFFTG